MNSDDEKDHISQENERLSEEQSVHSEEEQDDDDQEPDEEEQDDQEPDEEEQDDQDQEEDGALSDEEEEEDEMVVRKKKKKRRLNPFIEEEAAVDDDEDEEFDEDDEGPEADKEELEEMEKSYLDKGRHRKLDMQFQKEDDLDAEELAAQLKERYSRSDYGVFRGDKETVPQNVLIPGVRDPKLAMVKCKAGKERDIIFSLTKKYMNFESGSNAIKIHSVFYRNGIPGYIYVEGDNLENIKESIQGIMNVYSNSIKIVPVNEMTQCLTIKSKEKELLVGSWVRVKRGKYSGDIGQILNIDSAENVTIKLMPRIDAFGGPKRKKAEQRPPQKLFNYKDFESNRECEARDGGYYYQNDFYTREGYLEKSMKIISLQTDGVNPTLEEVTVFSGGAVEGGTDDVALLGAVAAASVEDFQVGENVEVILGELKNVKGTVQSVQNGVVTMLPDASFGFNEPIPFPATELRKKFDVGDHVKVASGIYKGVTGLVINIENNVTSILSDADLKPISVFSKDLKAATEITTGEVIGSQYSIDDFVQLSINEVGIILNIEKDSLTILTQDGNIVNVKPQAVRPRNEIKKAFGSDKNGTIFGINDIVEIVDGPPIVYRKKATVMAVFRRSVFLRSLEIHENRGNYVTTTESVLLLGAQKHGDRKSVHNNKHGALKFGNAGNRGRSGPGIRINSRVSIIQGPLKGYKGIVKHATDSLARIELMATSKIVNVEINKLKIFDDKNERTQQYRQDNDRATGFGAATPMHGGAKTPMARDGKTPAWDAGSKTPGVGAWGMSGTTPFSDRMDNNSSMASNQYSALADTPLNPTTPGVSSGWDVATPYNQATPAANGYPNMPSVPISAATPFVANDDSQVPGSLHDWITTDIEIKVGSNVSDESLDGIHGVIKEVDHASEKVTVKLYNGITSTLSADCLELVSPERRDPVKIVGGEYRNLLGVLISVDGADGVVKLSEGSEIKVLSMSILAKHKP